MNKAKSVCQQIFLYLLFSLSAASAVCSAILFGKANGEVSTKEFIDTAADSVDSAYALIEKRDMYAGMLKISIAACIVTVLLIVFSACNSPYPEKEKGGRSRVIENRLSPICQSLSQDSKAI